MGDGTNPYFIEIPGLTLKIKALHKDTNGKYSALLEVIDPGSQEKVTRVDFEQDGSKVNGPTSADATVSNLKDLVVGSDKAFAITALGDVVPLDVSSSISAGASLGKILDVPDHKMALGFCGLYQNDIYCSGLFNGVILQLFKFATDTKTQTTLVYSRPFLLSYVGSKLIVTYDLDGDGIEAFDLSKTPPQAAAIDNSGQAITAGNNSATSGTGGAPQPQALPSGAQAGGSGGCSLTPEAQALLPAQAIAAVGLMVGAAASLVALRRTGPCPSR